jgi:hypothetical protein
MLLGLPQDVIRSVACFRLASCPHPCVETATWNSTSSPTCNLCEADDDVQDEKHVIFHCTHPQMVSLRRKYAFLFSQTGPDVSAFLHQDTNKLLYFIHELILFFEQASGHTS